MFTRGGRGRQAGVALIATWACGQYEKLLTTVTDPAAVPGLPLAVAADWLRRRFPSIRLKSTQANWLDRNDRRRFQPRLVVLEARLGDGLNCCPCRTQHHRANAQRAREYLASAGAPEACVGRTELGSRVC